jgi:lipoprotein-anchoring transpeptidase ErfK/SrfK
MRFKIIALFLFLVILAGAGIVGWVKWQELKRQHHTANTLTLAMGQIGSGNHEGGQAQLELALKENPNLPDADSVWAKLAESYTVTKNTDKALACWKKIIEAFPASAHCAKALSAMADDAVAKGKPKDAEQIWDKILTNYKDSDSVDDAKWGKAMLLYEAGDSVATLAALNAILEQHPETNRRAEIEDLLGKINLEFLNSSEVHEGDEIYSIQRGDKLSTIGKKFNVSPDLVGRVNHIRDERMLTVNRRLKIPKTNFSLLVNKSDNTMVLLNNGKFFKRYRVRTGTDDWRTPVGTFHIQTKVKDPNWTDPKTGQRYGANDPGNQLGTRWMAFDVNAQLGIHGTIKPETIGQYASNGCVGMLKEDVEELFDLVPIGTEVKITGKMQKRATN